MLLLEGVAWVLRCAPAWMHLCEGTRCNIGAERVNEMLWQCINDSMCEGLRSESFKVVGWLRACLPWARCGVAIKERCCPACIMVMQVMCGAYLCLSVVYLAPIRTLPAGKA
jgi:hypothetical protein